MITLQDIADEAGVSIATVSHVVNGNTARVSAENAGRIQEILDKRGYIPNSSARSLAAKSSHIIAAVLIGGSENLLADPYNAEFLGLLTAAVQKRGYYLMIRFENRYEDVIANLLSWNVDGAVFVGTIDRYIRQIREKIAEKSAIPLIFTDSYTDLTGVNNVRINDYAGGVLAAEHFLQNGHRKLAFAGFAPYKIELPSEIKTEKNVVTERLRGFCDTLSHHGLALGAEPFFIDGNGAQQAEVERITERIIEAKTQCGISGVFVSADRIAVELLESLSQKNIRVPGDISLIGFDDIVISGIASPKLTTIRQDITQKVRVAADLLFRQITGFSEQDAAGENGKTIVLDVTLTERASVKNIS